VRHKREEPHFGQIQMEIHHVGYNTSVMVHVLQTLEDLGYRGRFFHAELNAYCERCSRDCAHSREPCEARKAMVWLAGWLVG